MRRIIEYRIDEGCNNQSIEKFLQGKGYTRQSIVDLKKMDRNVLINGKWEHMNARLIEGDILTVNIDEEASSENIKPVKLDFDIVYEDEDILVVNKPADMPIHPSRNNDDNTLGNGLVYYFSQKDESFVYRCINRLDRDTTGLVIIAKHQVAAGILYTQMQNRLIKREYLAVVCNQREDIPECGTVDEPIVRLTASGIERAVGKEGERAVTHYNVICSNNGFALIRLHLDTGRTHQIRVHMKHLKHPLVGDTMYNIEALESEISRPALHSYKMEFTHPITGALLEFVQELPEDMKLFCEKYELFWK